MAFSWFWRKCQQICSQGGNSPLPTKKALTNGLPAGEHTEVPRRRTEFHNLPPGAENQQPGQCSGGVTECLPPSSGLLELQGCCGNSFLPYPRGFNAAPRTEGAGQAPSWKKMGYGSRVNPWPVTHSCEGNSRRMALLWALLPSSSHYIKAKQPTWSCIINTNYHCLSTGVMRHESHKKAPFPSASFPSASFHASCLPSDQPQHHWRGTSPRQF